MTYLYMELREGEEEKAKLAEYLRQHSVGIEKAAEMVTRALQLVERAVPADGGLVYGVVLALARHVAESIDAVSILVATGSVEPCKAHLRSALEGDLSVRYVLEAESEKRAIAFHVKEIYERLQKIARDDERTAEGKRLRDSLASDKLATDILTHMPKYDFDAEKAKLEAVLARAPYDEIDAEWCRLKRPKWYSLFGGPNNVRELSLHLHRGFWYEYLYGDWSGHIHAGSVLRCIGKDTSDPTGESKAIKPLRHPEGIRNIYNYSLNIAVKLSMDLGERYLSAIGLDDLREFYKTEIRPISRKLDETKIEVPWK